MSNQELNSIEKAIDLARGASPRDFTEAEKQYISNLPFTGKLENPTFRDDLVYWFESRASDGYWTEANHEFMCSLDKTPKTSEHSTPNSINLKLQNEDKAAGSTRTQNTLPSAKVNQNLAAANNLAALITARNVLSSLGTDVYKSDRFSFEQSASKLIITDNNDGRGTIAQLDHGEVTGSITKQDSEYLRELNQAVLQSTKTTATHAQQALYSANPTTSLSTDYQEIEFEF